MKIKIKSTEVISALATACSGYSQISNTTIAYAALGAYNNAGFSSDEAISLIREIHELIALYFDDQDTVTQSGNISESIEIFNNLKDHYNAK